MLSFLKSAIRTDSEGRLDENRLLLDEFAALEPSQQDEAAEHLAVLWHCFAEAFGSPAEFHRADRTTQDAYIAKFERVAKRTVDVKHEARGHLHYSVAFMLRFLLIARDGADSPSAFALSGRVANLINRARERQIETMKTGLADALVAPSVKHSAQASTEVIVDRPVEFLGASDSGDAEQSRVRVYDAARARGATIIYMRDGERWVRRPTNAAKRAG